MRPARPAYVLTPISTVCGIANTTARPQGSGLSSALTPGPRARRPGRGDDGRANPSRSGAEP